MRPSVLVLATAALVLTSAAASAWQCRYGNAIGSSLGNTGINAVAPSQAVMNPCSSMYGFGARRHRHDRHHAYRTDR